MRAAWLVLLSALACGCVEQLPADLPASALGTTEDVPIGPVSGRAHSLHFFGWRRFGDDTTDAAVRNAKKGRQEDDLINVTVERRALCFPLCRYALLTWSETSVDGTLVRYHGLPDWKKPEASEAPALQAGRRPPAAELLERLMHLYSQSPADAAEFFASLDHASRQGVIERVLSEKGRTSAQGWIFKIPRDAPAAEKKFLAWFVGAYTTYQPLDE